MTTKPVLKLKAVVFDVDGMLLDTREFIFQAYEDTLRRFGYDVPTRKEIAKQIGRSLENCYVALAPGGDIQALCSAHDAFQSNAGMLELVTAYPGVPEMLQKLQDAHLKLAIFSSRKRLLVSSLQQTGIAEFFEVIIQGDEVTNHKPHPEGLFKALAGLEIAPKYAAMIGDAAVDILAGKAADVVLTVGITHGFGTREELEAVNPDHIVNGVNEITPLILGY
jgi:HAD superfamily hydrolase (TIGR01509 family)